MALQPHRGFALEIASGNAHSGARLMRILLTGGMAGIGVNT